MVNDIVITSTEDLAVLKTDDRLLPIFLAPASFDPLLTHIRSEIDTFDGDISTASGRKAVAAMAYKIARTKTRIDDIGKELTSRQKEIPKRIDATRKHLRDTLDSWRDEVRAPLTAWEDAEKARVDRHNANLTRLDQLGAIDGSPDEISSALNEAGAFELTANACDEFLAEYAEKREFAVSALTERLARAEQLERERQELERLRLEEQQRQQERLAAAAARAAAEAARAEAEIKAQREKEAAFHRETQLRLEKEQAERRALEAEAAARERVAQEAAEAERRAAAAAADEKNRVRVHTEIVSRLCSAGLSATDAQIVVDVLIAGVPHVTINY